MAKLTRAEKEELVSKMATWFKESPSTVFVNFNGLKIENEQKMRNALKEQGMRYFVARKTLIKLALDKAEIKGNMPELEGELAVAFMESSNDITAPAREISSFSKEFDESLRILGGIFEGEYKDAGEMNEIASIPSMDVLRGMFVNVINSPVQGLAIVLSEIAKKKEA